MLWALFPTREGPFEAQRRRPCSGTPTALANASSTIRTPRRGPKVASFRALPCRPPWPVRWTAPTSRPTFARTPTWWSGSVEKCAPTARKGRNGRTCGSPVVRVSRGRRGPRGVCEEVFRGKVSTPSASSSKPLGEPVDGRTAANPTAPGEGHGGLRRQVRRGQPRDREHAGGEHDSRREAGPALLENDVQKYKYVLFFFPNVKKQQLCRSKRPSLPTDPLRIDRSLPSRVVEDYLRRKAALTLQAAVRRYQRRKALRIAAAAVIQGWWRRDPQFDCV